MTDNEAGARAFQNLIVVGASAGGIEALSALVGSLPAEFLAPIVIAQHLSPHRSSSLAEILSRRAPIPVRTVTGREPLKPGVIFVVPPNRDVVITDHEVSVLEEDGAGPRPSVDVLFRSAAQIFGEDLIAVILSGSGSDGSAGAREVKRAGGTIIVQNPETASFPGMPLSLAPSIVDIVANPEQIGPLLNDLLNGTYTAAAQTDDDEVRSFLDQLRDESGIDFTSYKQPTILRRLQRRMAATAQPTLAEYVRFLRQHPDERQRLIASFLIKVTEFFRDQELFTHLREQILPELIADARKRDEELRLWSAGCATGEEAYSLAMMVADLVAKEGDGVSTRIFATDLDGEAVGFARHGVYPARALANVPPTMLERYFAERDGEYEVKKALRSLLVFGEHDLAQRAPFPRIDLVLCRNVLIYFTAALQRRALQLFAYSLRPGGYLALGKSESVSPLAEYFNVDQPRLKVFQRVGDRALIPPIQVKESLPLMPPRSLPSRLGATGLGVRTGRAIRDPLRPRGGNRSDQVLLGLPLGVVVVDRDYDIQSINAVARRMFGIHTSAIDRDFIHLVQKFPAADLRRQIDRSFAGAATDPVVLASADAPNEPISVIEVTTYPLSLEQDNEERLVAVTARDVTERDQLRRASEGADVARRRLVAANEELLAANLELTGTIARFHVENEELLVSAEEVQAATEEVETLNEELQASNEELETLNEELQATVEELNTTNDDLQARTIELQEMAISSDAARSDLQLVLTSIGDAVAVVDKDGGVVLTNASYDRYVKTVGDAVLNDSDGYPLPLEATPLKRAARRETFTMPFGITTGDGIRRWYEADGRPIPRNSNLLGVVTIRDVSERSLRHLQDQWMSVASHELRTPLTALQAYLQMAARTWPPEADGGTRRYLDRAMNQIRRMDNLVSQLIDVTRFQQGRLVLDLSRVDLGAVVRQAVETVEALAPARTIVADDVTTEAIIIGDGLRLEQIVLNLLMNAVHHAPGSEQITVHLHRRDDVYELQVHDDGPGIPEHDQPEIFERFSQIVGGGSSGLGLGLFIARVLVTEHGGTIDVESSADAGTTFTVHLPVAPDDLSAPS